MRRRPVSCTLTGEFSSGECCSQARGVHEPYVACPGVAE